MNSIVIVHGGPGATTTIYLNGRVLLSTVFVSPHALDNALCILFSVSK